MKNQRHLGLLFFFFVNIRFDFLICCNGLEEAGPFCFHCFLEESTILLHGREVFLALFSHARRVLGGVGGGSDLLLEQGPQHY